MVHELVRYMKSMNMHGEKIKVKKCFFLFIWSMLGDCLLLRSKHNMQVTGQDPIKIRKQ